MMYGTMNRVMCMMHYMVAAMMNNPPVVLHRAMALGHGKTGHTDEYYCSQ